MLVGRRRICGPPVLGLTEPPAVPDQVGIRYLELDQVDALVAGA
jgi:hypothetical protein